jgi:uncharacterized phage infection (PIP) family protein YhgE
MTAVPPTTLAEISEQQYAREAQFAHRLAVAVYDVNYESGKRDLMAVQVKGLADTIRSAKEAIGKASAAAERMKASANDLTGTLAVVEDVTNQLDTANADLKSAVGLLSNGGPPLGQ